MLTPTLKALFSAGIAHRWDEIVCPPYVKDNILLLTQIPYETLTMESLGMDHIVLD